MKTPNHQQYSEPHLTISPVQYLPVEPGDKGPLGVKPARQLQSGSYRTAREYNCSPHEPELDNLQDSQNAHGVGANSGSAGSYSNATKPSGRPNKQRVRALTDLIVQLPEGGTREVVSEAFTAIINGEGDIKHLRALTMRAARQLRTMYLSGGEKSLLADVRWKVKDFVWTNFGLQISIGPRGLHLGEGQGPDELNAFLRIEANGHVWAGESYEETPGQPTSFPLTTEDVFERLSEKLLTFLY